MHPGFHIICDNLNLDVKPRKRTLENQGTHLDLVQGMAVLDRVNCRAEDSTSKLSSSEVLSLPECAWLLSPDEHDQLIIRIGTSKSYLTLTVLSLFKIA